MKVLIIGGSGMLGHQLCRTLGDRFEIWATFRGEPGEFERYGFIPQERTVAVPVDWQLASRTRPEVDTKTQEG